MKNKPLRILCAAVACALVAAAATSTAFARSLPLPSHLTGSMETNGILHNGGFENGMQDWNLSENSSFAYDTEVQAHTGLRSAYLTYTQSTGLQNHISQASAAGAGTYVFSAYVKTESSLSGVGAALFLEARDADNRVLASTNSASVNHSGGVWAPVTVKIDAPPKTVKIVAKIAGIYCTGSFYVDDAFLQQIA